MKRILVILAIAVSGCAETPSERVEMVRPVDAEFLRGEYVKSFIDLMDEGQFAGDAETAFEGGDKLMQTLFDEAAEVYPDGEYVEHYGSGSDVRDISGYTRHSVALWNGRGLYHQVYKKN